MQYICAGPSQKADGYNVYEQAENYYLYIMGGLGLITAAAPDVYKRYNGKGGR